MRTLASTFFESKVRVERTKEDGSTGKINELYVVQAVSFTDCEAKVIQHVSQYTSGEFEVLTETKAKYREIFFSDKPEEEVYYRAQLSFVTLDEKTGKTRKSKNIYLVQGKDIDSARKNIDEVMSGTMIDYVIEALAESAVVDIITDVEKAQEQ